MNRLLVTTALALALSSGGAQAGAIIAGARPAFMVGIAVEFGDSVENSDIGLTAKVISSNQPDQFVIGAGVAYFPWATEKFGLDLDVGYHFYNGAAMAGYDFLRQKPQLSIGWVPESCAADFFLATDGNCYSSAPSDRRLKRDIVLLATLHDGMKIYSYKYLWSDTTYVGVMAQDLLMDPRWRLAVTTGEDGFYSVFYEKLDLAMVTLDVWSQQGLESIVRGARRPELLVASAA